MSQSENLRLHAGPLSLDFTQGDIRNLRVAGREVIQRIYAAVRDGAWGTVPGDYIPQSAILQANAFLLNFRTEHKQESVHFVWRGTLTGAADGTLTFELDGEALTDFQRNRIGFCILHPMECAGVDCLVEHVDGSHTTATLPERIVPDQPVTPFAEMRALTLLYADGLRMRIEMEGDIFEMEDQRNWTDASYKTFCTPLRLPFPVSIAAGTRIQQKITVRIENLPDAPAVEVEEFSPIVLEEESDVRYVVPSIGLAAPSIAAPLNVASLELLQRLHMAHLRIELPLAPGADWKTPLERGALLAQSIDAPFEVALLLPDAPDNLNHLDYLAYLHTTLTDLRTALEALGVPVARWLVLPALENLKRPQPFETWLPSVKKFLQGYAPSAPFFAGTSSDFIFLNRFPPPLNLCDGVTFAINPQVHAFDDLSLMQTLPAQTALLHTARAISQDRPVCVSPITLLPRFNPYSATATQARGIPPADPRQITQFGAVWTLGSLRALIAGGASSLTYYETSGAGGLLNEEIICPMYGALAEVCAFQGGFATLWNSSDRSAIGITLSHDGRRRTLIANHSPHMQEIRLHGLSDDNFPKTLSLEGYAYTAFDDQ